MMRLGHLSTEGARAERAEIDRLPTDQLVRLMNADDAIVPAAVGEAAPAIAAAVDAIVGRLEAGGGPNYVRAGNAGPIRGPHPPRGGATVHHQPGLRGIPGRPPA